jgi:hypothetical protein
MHLAPKGIGAHDMLYRMRATQEVYSGFLAVDEVIHHKAPLESQENLLPNQLNALQAGSSGEVAISLGAIP